MPPCSTSAPVTTALPPRISPSVVSTKRAVPHHRAKLRWGLVPSWAKDIKIGARLINARAETVHFKPSFSAAFRFRRCLVPANGWFEWKRAGPAKQPWFVAPAEGSPLSFAALWERWDKAEEPVESFTIVTTAATPDLAGIHERQPAIIPPARFDQWLDPASPLATTARPGARTLSPAPSSRGP